MSMALINRLTEAHGYPLLDENNFDDFIGRHEETVLFFTEDPKRHKETLDVAVILPELVKSLDRQLTPAVVSRRYEDRVSERFHVRQWPSLVFLRRGAYLGQIPRVQDWQDYLDLARDILEKPAAHGPLKDIPTVTL